MPEEELSDTEQKAAEAPSVPDDVPVDQLASDGTDVVEGLEEDDGPPSEN